MDVKETLNQREGTHGNFTTNARVSQVIKQTYRQTDAWPYLPVEMKESLDMIACKISRILSGNPYHMDSWHDIGGYAALVERKYNKDETTAL